MSLHLSFSDKWDPNQNDIFGWAIGIENWELQVDVNATLKTVFK